MWLIQIEVYILCRTVGASSSSLHMSWVVAREKTTPLVLDTPFEPQAGLARTWVACQPAACLAGNQMRDGAVSALVGRLPERLPLGRPSRLGETTGCL